VGPAGPLDRTRWCCARLAGTVAPRWRFNGLLRGPCRPIRYHRQNSRMPNIANLLKAEIVRVARKTVRAELQALKQSVGTYRTEVAALKKRIAALEQQLRRLDKPARSIAHSTSVDATQAGDEPSRIRFSAKGLAIATAPARSLGRTTGAAGWRVGTVRLQLGSRQGPTTRQAPVGAGGAQDAGQEGSGRTAGCASVASVKA
jgi:hypothetical protein